MNRFSIERLRWLAFFLLLCLVPRAFMAWKIGGLCNDAPTYIRAAESHEQGRLPDDKFNRIGLNLFPLILAALHRVGLDWELAGKLWNVAISCLTVLPLYGWVRRQFDDRTALAAGILYALHAELIRSSPEGIRDPTFWFLMVLSLYLLWRAVVELRLVFFLAGGLALTAAAMTRTEGWFLLVPLVLWSWWRGTLLPSPACRTRQDGRGAGGEGNLPVETARWLRKKLLLGVLLAVCVFPAIVLLAATIWFRGHAPWELVRTKPLEFIAHWIEACRTGGGSGDSAALAVPPWTARVGLFAAAMFKGISPIFILFLLLGVAGWWGTWKRREHQAIAYTALVFLLAIWIHQSAARETVSRYFLPVVLLMIPFAALGLLAVSQRLAQWAVRRSWGPSARQVAAWLPLALFGIYSLGNVAVCDYRQRGGQAELGRWAETRFGHSPAVLGPSGVTQVVAHYAQGSYHLFDTWDDDLVIEEVLRQHAFDMVLLLDSPAAPQTHAALLRYAAGRGFSPLDDQPFCGRLHNMSVLVHTNPKR